MGKKAGTPRTIGQASIQPAIAAGNPKKQLLSNLLNPSFKIKKVSAPRKPGK